VLSVVPKLKASTPNPNLEMFAPEALRIQTPYHCYRRQHVTSQTQMTVVFKPTGFRFGFTLGLAQRRQQLAAKNRLIA